MRQIALLGIMAVLLSGCGAPAAGAPTEVATSGPTVAVPTPTRPAAPPTATPAPAQPTATPVPATPDTVWVGNTDGEGVYIRHSPSLADRVRAYPDGTPLKIAGEDVVGDGQQWHHVQTPDGLDGYVPVMYTLDAQP